MKSKRLEMGSSEWVSAWNELLTKQVAIRSSIQFGLGLSRFTTELTFKINDPSQPEIYRMRCKRILGDSIERPATELETFEQPLADFLEGLRDREFQTKSSALADRCLQPVPHVPTVSQLYTEDKLILPASHPLLMLHYGMIYEGITTRVRHSIESEPLRGPRLPLWQTLERRFGVFVYQQEAIMAQNTIGQIP